MFRDIAIIYSKMQHFLPIMFHFYPDKNVRILILIRTRGKAVLAFLHFRNGCGINHWCLISLTMAIFFINLKTSNFALT